MRPRYGPRVEASSMRCPRCLGPWDRDYVDLAADRAECRPCALVVALHGLLVPEWSHEDVASRLDRVGAAPPLGGVSVSESMRPRAIEARGTGSFLRTAPRLALGADGAREERAFQRPNLMPLTRMARVVPAVHFAREGETPVATALVCVVGSGDADATGPRLETGSWDAARYVAARFEVVRRALTERGAYR